MTHDRHDRQMHDRSHQGGHDHARHGGRGHVHAQSFGKAFAIGIALNAFLHTAADAGVSAGVVATGLLIVLTGWLWLDPVASLIIVLAIVVGTWVLMRDPLNPALDAVPEGIEFAAVDAALRALPGVIDVHDLHIWGLSTTQTALTAHLVHQDHDPAALISWRATKSEISSASATRPFRSKRRNSRKAARCGRPMSSETSGQSWRKTAARFGPLGDPGDAALQ